MLSSFLGGSIRAEATGLTSGTAAPDVWLVDLLGGFTTATGLRVGPREAQTVPGISACLQVISDDLAKVPCVLYRRKGDGREEATDHAVHRLLKNGPAPWLTSFQWRKALYFQAGLRGNGFSRVFRDARGQVQRATLPRPGGVTTRWDEDGQPFFDISTMRGVVQGLSYQDVLHLPYRGSTEIGANGGIFGQSPLDQHRESVAISVATERFVGRFFANGARPSAVLEMDKTFKDDAVAARTRRQVEGILSGLDNAGKVAIFELGMKLKQWASNNNDAELSEIRKQQGKDHATMFRVPPHKIGILDEATFSNIEHQGMEYRTDTIVPLAAMGEQQMEICLLSASERDEFFIEFDLDDLDRGDIASRYRAYSIGRQWGWLNVDTIRRWERLNPLPNGQGQDYLVPLNMISAEDTGKAQDADQAARKPGPAGSRNRP
jgi:HK97 family phage portal protein